MSALNSAESQKTVCVHARVRVCVRETAAETMSKICGDFWMELSNVGWVVLPLSDPLGPGLFEFEPPERDTRLEFPYL